MTTPTPTLTCPQGHETEGHQGPDGTWYCTICYTMLDPAKLSADKIHYSAMGKAVPNKPRVVTPGYSYQPPPQFTCLSGHPNNKDAKFCGVCGAAMPEPVVTQHERIAMAANGEDLPPVNAGSANGVFPPQYQQFALPTVATTVWITIFFGLFGLIPASMHTNRAQSVGRPTNKYWAAFGWTMAASVTLWLVLYFALFASMSSALHSSSSYTPYTPPTTTQQYTPPTTQPYSSGTTYPYFSVTQHSGDSQLMSNAIAADTSGYWTKERTGAVIWTSSAVCEPNTDAVSWQFNCNITFADNSYGSFWVSWSSSTSNGRYAAAHRMS